MAFEQVQDTWLWYFTSESEPLSEEGVPRGPGGWRGIGSQVSRGEVVGREPSAGEYHAEAMLRGEPCNATRMPLGTKGVLL